MDKHTDGLCTKASIYKGNSYRLFGDKRAIQFEFNGSCNMVGLWLRLNI